MEVNAYVLRAVLARTELDDEGAAQVGTSIKENLGNATTVEEALRNMAQFGNDLSGFNKYVPYLLTLGRQIPKALGGAGITISGSEGGDSYRVDAKGLITSDYVWTNPGDIVGSARIIQPDLRFSNMWYPQIPPNASHPSIIMIDPLGIDVGNTFTVKVDSTSFPVVGPPPHPVPWWANINWTGGQPPDIILPTPPDFAGTTLYAFVKINTSRYDGFIIGSKIP